MSKTINILNFVVVFIMIFLSCFNMISASFFYLYRTYLVLLFIVLNIILLIVNINSVVKKEKELFLISVIGISFYLFTKIFIPDDTVEKLGASLLLINLLLTIVNFNILSISERSKKFLLLFIATFSLLYIINHSFFEQTFNSNTVATFSFPLMIYSFIWLNYNKTYKILSFFIFVIFFCFSFYMQCRSVMLGELLFIFLITSKILSKNIHVSKILIFFTIVISVCFPMFLVFMWNEGINFTVPFVNKGFIYTGRERVWAYFLEKFTESPLFGIGEGTISVPLMDYNSFAPHNFMFNILVVYGIIIFIVFFFILMYVLSDKIKKQNKNASFFLAYNGFISILITSIFETIPISYIHVILIWFLLVILNDFKNAKLIQD